MKKWKVNFLISGFEVESGTFKIGNIIFSKVDTTSLREITLLQKSADFAKFQFGITRFPKATVEIEEDDYKKAAMKGLFEIDRTLDTLVFSSFSKSKYLSVGYVENINNNSESYPIEYLESSVPTPLLSRHKTTMNSLYFYLSEDYIKHFEHLLTKDPKNFTESEEKLATALRWCRLGSLSRFHGQSTTPAFIFEWIALETLIRIDEDTRVKDRLKLTLDIMKHFPLEVISNYSRDLTKSGFRKLWWEKIDFMYENRKEIFHEGKLDIRVGFRNLFNTKEYKSDIGLIEAILSRILSFVSKGSRKYSTLKEIWDDAKIYVPTRDDNPVSNLGGWSEIF